MSLHAFSLKVILRLQWWQRSRCWRCNTGAMLRASRLGADTPLIPLHSTSCLMSKISKQHHSARQVCCQALFKCFPSPRSRNSQRFCAGGQEASHVREGCLLPSHSAESKLWKPVIHAAAEISRDCDSDDLESFGSSVAIMSLYRCSWCRKGPNDRVPIRVKALKVCGKWVVGWSFPRFRCSWGPGTACT